MGAYLIYLKLEMKRAIKTLPRFFTGAIVLVCLLSTIAFSASKIMYGDTLITRILVGVALPEDDRLAQKAIEMLASMDSVASVCDFIYLDEEAGLEQLRTNQIHALLLVPSGFVSDIITGVNTPVVMILPDGNGIETSIFKELTDAGARILGTAQAGIYAADELCLAYQIPNEIPAVEEYLNRIAMSYSLPREDYYRDYQVSATNDISVLEYYLISAAVLCLFFCAFPLAVFCGPEKLVLRQKLQLAGIGRAKQILAKMLAVAVLLSVLSACAAGVLLAAQWVAFKPVFIAVIILVCAAIASIIVAIYHIAGSPVAGVMCLFWVTLGMLFLAGGLVPAVFLPESLRTISAYVPAKALIDLMKVFVGLPFSWAAAWRVVLWSMICYLAAILAGGKR